MSAFVEIHRRGSMAAQFINIAHVISVRSDEGGGVIVVEGGSDFGTDESYDELKYLLQSAARKAS